MSWQGFEKSNYELEGLGMCTKGEKKSLYLFFDFLEILLEGGQNSSRGGDVLH
jgi:hypothetical protein